MPDLEDAWTAHPSVIQRIVANDESVIRRLMPGQYIESKGRPSSLAFYKSSDPYEISVDREKYRNTRATLAGHEGFGAVRLNVGSIRDLPQNLDVEAAPITGNPAHANIMVPITMKTNAVKKRVCKALACASEMVVLPQ